MTTETLTFPIDATFQFAADASTSITLELSGTIVAKSTFTPSLGGDYNNNGMVDAADYALWRNNLGNGTSLPNDDTAGVGEDDYTRWRSNFGSTSGSSASLGEASTVPEPSMLVLLALAASVMAQSRRLRFQ
jgi:hypothetical protein